MSEEKTFVVQKEKKLDDGLHNGVIKEISYRTEPYEYTDVHIELADGFRVKTSYSSFVSPSSKLGRLLERFGAGLEVDNEINPNITLLEKKCQFQSITEGKFYKIISESVKPIE